MKRLAVQATLVIALYYGRVHFYRTYNTQPASTSSNSDYYAQLIRSAIGPGRVMPKEEISNLEEESGSLKLRK